MIMSLVTSGVSQARDSVLADFVMHERQIGEICILDLKGKITCGEGSRALREAIRHLVEEGRDRILLNFARIGYADSSCIGELVAGSTLVRRQGGQLKFVHLTPNLKALCGLMNLRSVFDVYDDEQVAISAFEDLWPSSVGVEML